jgi:hypothetical protein
MGSLLTSITGQLAIRAIILGTFFPVVLFSALNILFVGPLISWSRVEVYLQRLATGDDKWGVVTLTLTVTAITGILYNLNTTIIRFFEGYPWEKSWIGEQCKKPHKARFRQAGAVQKTLRSMRQKMLSATPPDPRAESLGNIRTPLALMLNSQLPDREDLVLPTRLGNVIRCFERYPSVAYGMDAIALWPRLVSSIGTGLAGSLDDAKTTFDFMLHCSFLSGMTAAAVITIGLSDPNPVTWPSTLRWLWRTGLFLVLARVFYEAAIGRADAWGTQVKSAFDLYRFDLLKQLGYHTTPESPAEERALWRRISLQLLYAFVYEPNEPRVLYEDAASRIQLSGAVRVEVSRTIAKASAPAIEGRHRWFPGTAKAPAPGIDVSIVLRNADPAWKETGMITLVEAVPEGYHFKESTLTASAGLCRIMDLKPLKIELSSLQPNQSCTVVYTAEAISSK